MNNIIYLLQKETDIKYTHSNKDIPYGVDAALDGVVFWNWRNTLCDHKCLHLFHVSILKGWIQG